MQCARAIVASPIVDDAFLERVLMAYFRRRWRRGIRMRSAATACAAS